MNELNETVSKTEYDKAMQEMECFNVINHIAKCEKCHYEIVNNSIFYPPQGDMNNLTNE